MSDVDVTDLARLIAAELAPILATAIADAISDHAPRPAPAPLATADEAAAALGVTADYVRRHADELGALRVGDGPRPRLRFDLDRARAALAPKPAPATPTRLRRASRPHQPADLLPIRRSEAA
jgi:hypothetical protein